MERRAGALREELHSALRPPDVRVLLLGLGPAHDRAEGERRDVLGRQHARQRALERDDDRDRAGTSASKVERVNAQGREPLTVFGAGWVGLVTAACFAELGHEVTVRDVVPEKVERLQKGEVPFFEPGLGDLLERNRERLTFTLDAAEAAEAAELVFVCVDTPPTYSGDADLSRVWTVIDELPQLDRRSILVMKSTVPVGTGDKVRAALEARGLSHIGYVSNPEFLAEGTAVEHFMNPDRFVVGAFLESDADRVSALYEPLETTVVRADVASAEMIKLAANAFLTTKISFINEIANVCELVGADVIRVAQGVGLDHRLGPHFLRAGAAGGDRASG